jgi:hypothetical protein
LLARVARGDVEDAFNAVRIQSRKVSRRANASNEDAGKVLVAINLNDGWVRGVGL